MPRLLCLFCACLLALPAVAQARFTPPEAVAARFGLLFPEAKEVTWQAAPAGPAVAEVAFLYDGQPALARFDSAGALVFCRKAVAATRLPKPLLAALAKNEAGWAVGQAHAIETLEGRHYEVQLGKAGQQKTLLLNGRGTAYAPPAASPAGG